MYSNLEINRYKKDDVLKVDEVKIEFVSEFCYLGVVFQATGNSFGRHVEKRAREALMATYI
jgi:hypothetical protein